MTGFDQDTRPLRVKLGDVPADGVLLTGFTGTEAVSDLYTFRLTLLAPVDAPLRFEDVLGKPAVVSIDQDGATRHVHGIVSRFQQDHRDDRFAHYRAELVPPLWLLTRTSRSRIFQQQTVREIIEAVIGPLYGPVFRLEGTYHPRNFCAQYRESDFAFISRLMEEEGMYYYFTHSEDEHGLVISDNPRGHADTPGDATLRFHSADHARFNDRHITRWGKVQELYTPTVELTDHTFEIPANDLRATGRGADSVAVGTTTHDLTIGNVDKFAVVEHPGGFAHWRDGIGPGGAARPADLDPLFQDNLRIARVRLAQEQTRAVRIDGAGTYCRMTAGHKFTLADHFDADGDYVAVAVTHTAACVANVSGDDNDFTCSNAFECLPLALPFRPARRTPRPVVKGTQTAVVVGDDPEIDPDKFGRVKVRFRWDPQGPRGLESSCWVRVAQSWAGRQWGTQFIPRVGDEVVVAFLEGDPDQPLIIGSVYNADNNPIYALPQNKTQTGIKTHSSPGGNSENFNEIKFEDRKGQELVSIHAEKDMLETVENNFTRSVGGGLDGDPKKVGKSTTAVYGDHSLTVQKGDFAIDVQAGKATVTVNKEIDVKSNTSFVHVDSPTEIRLSVKGSTVTITPDTITLHAEHIVFEGTTDIKGVTPDLNLQGSDVVYVHGDSVAVDGYSDASFQSSSGKADFLAATTATLGVSDQTVVCNAGKVAVSGKAIQASAQGTHEITGSLVKIN